MPKRIAFKDIFTKPEQDRSLFVEPDETYNCVGVRWWGNGAFIRELKDGSDIKKKKQFRIREGDIVYNKLFAWRGAFAVAEKGVDNCIVSDKFPLYRLNSIAVSLDYLRVIFQSQGLANDAATKSTGMAALSKFTLNPPKFWELTIPELSLEEQGRLVELVRKIDKEIKAIKLASDYVGRAASVVTKKLTSQLIKEHPKTPMRQIGGLLRRSMKIEDDVSYRQVTIAMNNRGLRLRTEKYGSDIGVKNQSFVKEGDLVFSRIDIRNGALGFVPKDLDGAIVANDFPVFVVNDDVNKDYLDLCFRTSEFKAQSESKSAGATNRKKMRRESFLTLEIPLPDSDIQASLVRYIHSFEKEVGAIDKTRKALLLQAENARRTVVNQIYAGEDV